MKMELYILVFWEVVNRYVGFEHKEGNQLSALAAHILLTALSVTMKESFFSGLETFISEPHQGNCYSMIHEWMHSDDDDVLYDICRSVKQ